MFDAPSRGDGWRRFLERYPNSYLVQFSRVGFSGDGSQAVTHVSFAGWFSSYYVLSLRDGQWRIVGEFGRMVE